MATYDNDLRLTELTTGDEIGSWGDVSNLNLELIAESLSYATQDGFASDADATTTVADGATDPARSMYLKVTSSATLTATRTLTIAPNDMSRVMFVENATTGSQSITIAQGSGGTVTIPTGASKLIYLDGAGAGAAVVDISSKLALDGGVIGGTTAAAGTFTAVTVDNIVIDGDVINYGSGDVTQTFTANTLAFAGGNTYTFDVEPGDSNYVESFHDTGTAARKIHRFSSDVYGVQAPALDILASGALSWNSGDVTLTYSANSLAFAGANSGYDFDGPVSTSNDGYFEGNTTTNGGIPIRVRGPNTTNNTEQGSLAFRDGGGNILGEIIGYRGTNNTFGELIFETRQASTLTEILRLGSTGTATFTNASTGNAVFIDQNGSGNALYTDGGDVVVTNGDVGIGTSSPETLLHISSGGGVTPFASTQFISESTGNNYIELNGGSTSSVALYFGDSTDQDVGGVLYNHSSDSMSFRAAGAARATIDSTGLDVTGTVTAAAGSFTTLSATGDLTLGNDIVSDNSTDVLFITGDTSVSSGGNIVLFPTGHANAGDINFREGTTSLLRYDADNGTGTWEFSTPVEIDGNLGVGTTASSNLQAHFYRNVADSQTQVYIEQDNASGSGIPLWIQNDGTGTGIFLDQNGNGDGLVIDSEATTETALSVDTVNTSGPSAVIFNNAALANTGNAAVLFLRQLNASATAPVIRLENDGVGEGIFAHNTDATNPDPVILARQDGTGNAVFIDQNGNGNALYIDSETTTQNAVRVVAANTTATVMRLDADSLTSGSGLYVASDSSGFTSSSGLLNVVVNNASASGRGIRVQQDGSGDAINIDNNGSGNAIYADGGNIELRNGQYIEEYAATGTSGAVTIDLDTGNLFSTAMAGAVTYTFSNAATSGLASSFTLKVVNNGSAITWPTSVDWPSGTAPTLSASGATDVFTFFTHDGGTTWYGFTAGQGMA